jgi:hypothetical protein
VGTSPLDPVRRPFRAAAETFVPELAGADAETWARLEATVAAALAQRPASMVRQLVAFVRLVDAWALLRRGRRLARLAPPRRAALLHGLERAPLLPVRRGVWGLRTLVFMGYYTQPAVVAALGYRADPNGWEAPR